jgi:hypothetical protein
MEASSHGEQAVNAQELLSSYRHLALTVIERAFRDVMMGACSPAERQSAREFLGGSPILRHWCRVAGLDPRRVITLASHLESDRSGARGRDSLKG